MAKDKVKKGAPNRHLHARISYLQQAATYLTVQNGVAQVPGKSSSPETKDKEAKATKTLDHPTDVDQARPADAARAQHRNVLDTPASGGLSLYLTSHLTQVARKSQIRLHTNIKHSICKRCGTVLVEGTTCSKSIENLSKGGKKPHADVLVVECGVCGAQKRWPIGAQRQRKKALRPADGGNATGAVEKPAEGTTSVSKGEIEQMH